MEREGKLRLRSDVHEENTPVRTLSEIHENVIYERLCDIEEKQRKWIETSKTLGNPQSEKEREEQREWIRSVTFRETNDIQYTPKKCNTRVKVITPPQKAVTPQRKSVVTPPQKGTPSRTGVITPTSSTFGYCNVPNLKLHASHVTATAIEPLVKPDAEFISDDGKLVKILKIEAPPVLLRPSRETTPKKPKPDTLHSTKKPELNTDCDGKSTESLMTRLNLEIEKVGLEEKKIEKGKKERKSTLKHSPVTPKKKIVLDKDDCVKPSPPKVKTYDVKLTRDFIRQKQKEREERALEEKKKKEIETEEKKKKLIELKETQRRILRSCKRRMMNDKPQWIGPLEVQAKDKKEKSPIRRPLSRETPKLHMNYSSENVEKMRQKAEIVRNVFLRPEEPADRILIPEESTNSIFIPDESENLIIEPTDFQHVKVKNLKKKRNKDSPMKDSECVRKEKRQKTLKMGTKSYFEAAPWENPLSKKEERPVTPDWLKELAVQPDPFNLINTFKRKLRMIDVKEKTKVENSAIDEDLLNLSAERISRYAFTTKKDRTVDSLKLSQSLDELNLKYPQIEKDTSEADDATYNVEKVETKNVLVSVNYDDFKMENKENATQTSDLPLMPYNLVTSSFLYPAYHQSYTSENGQIVQKVYAESVFSESSESMSEIVQISRTLTKNRKKKAEGASGVMQVTSLRSSIHDPPFDFYDSASSADKNTTYTSIESYSQSNYEGKPLEMKIAKITTQVLEDMRGTNHVQKSLDLISNSSIQKAKEDLEEMESVRLKLIEKGKDSEASSLKKRERALMLKLYQDLKEIARLRKLEKANAKVNESESLANQMKALKEKEETLKERQKNVEAIVAWKQRLEQEEQKIKKFESVIAHSPFNSPLPVTFPRTIDRGTSPILGLTKPNLDSDNCSDSLEHSSVSEPTLKNVTIRRHIPRVQYRRRSMGINSPLTPRVTIIKRRNSTGSDDSVTMSQNDTLSESDMESRVSALQHQLKERKIILEKLKKEYNKSQRERLRAKEQSLLNQIQAYDSYIEQIKTDLQNEIEKDVKVTKPQIKQPKCEKKKSKIDEKVELESKKFDKSEESETQSKTLKASETDLKSVSEYLIDPQSKIETLKTEIGEAEKETMKSVSEIIQKDSQDTSLVSVSEIDVEYSKSMSEIVESLIEESSMQSISENLTVSEEKTLKTPSEVLKTQSELRTITPSEALKTQSELKTTTPIEALQSQSEFRTNVETPKSETEKTEETLKTGSVETAKTETKETSGETPKTQSVETASASVEETSRVTSMSKETSIAEEIKTAEETASEIPTVEEVAESLETKFSRTSNQQTSGSSENLVSMEEKEDINKSIVTNSDSSSPTLIPEKNDSFKESMSEYLPTMKSESESKRSISNLIEVSEENCQAGDFEIDSGDMGKVIEMFGNGFGLEDKLWKENLEASEQMEKTPLLDALQREQEKAINVDFLTQTICAKVIDDATEATVEAFNKKKKFAEKYNERWNRGDGPWNEVLSPQAIREAEELRKKQLQIEQEIEQLEAQEVPYFYMREIPNKPPPPYTPPKFLPPTKEEILSRVSDAIEILWDESLKENDIQDIEPPSNYLSDIQDKSYVKFMFDLSKELFLKFKPKKVDVDSPWIEKPTSKPLPPIRSKSDLMKYVEKETEIVFGFKPKIIRENMIMKWSRKKRDLVDEILVRELQDEEFEWTNFAYEENLVKNEISEAITEFMISEAAKGLKEAFLKKIVNFR